MWRYLLSSLLLFLPGVYPTATPSEPLSSAISKIQTTNFTLDLYHSRSQWDVFVDFDDETTRYRFIDHQDLATSLRRQVMHIMHMPPDELFRRFSSTATPPYSMTLATVVPNAVITYKDIVGILVRVANIVEQHQKIFSAVTIGVKDETAHHKLVCLGRIYLGSTYRRARERS